MLPPLELSDITVHLADTFIQSDLQCIQAIHFFCQYMCSLGIEPTTFALLTQCSTTEPQKLVDRTVLKSTSCQSNSLLICETNVKVETGAFFAICN